MGPIGSAAQSKNTSFGVHQSTGSDRKRLKYLKSRFWGVTLKCITANIRLTFLFKQYQRVAKYSRFMPKSAENKVKIGMQFTFIGN